MDKFFNKIIGSESEFSLEFRIFNLTAIIGIIFSFYAGIINLTLGLNLIVTSLPFILCIFIFFIYYISRIKGKYEFQMSIALFFLILIIYPLTWIYNGGSYGTMAYYFIFNAVILAALSNKIKYKMFLIIQFFVLIFLFFIEYKFPNIIVGYNSPEDRYLDLATSLFTICGVSFFLVWKIMNEYNRKMSELSRVHHDLKILSITDELTGIFNRRHIMNKLEEELEVSVIMFDIDNFKWVNDKYGHGFGDKVICMVSQTFKSNIRNIDVLGRIGGEEFLIILPEADLDYSNSVAEKLRLDIENLKWEYEDLTITVSGGVYCKSKMDSIDFILSKVDQGLYRAKNSGRNIIKN